MNYQTYLQSDHWKEIRKLHYKNVKNSSCYICGSKENLNVHHRRYFRKSSGNVLFHEQNRMHVLVTLCSDCHSTWHKYQDKRIFKPKFKDRILHLISLGYSKHEAIKLCSGRFYKEAKNTQPNRQAVMGVDTNHYKKGMTEQGTQNSWRKLPLSKSIVRNM